MIGPGKYDPEATAVRLTTNAQAVLLQVINGDKGSGFSVQCIPEIVPLIPTLLRSLADAIERQSKPGG